MAFRFVARCVPLLAALSVAGLAGAAMAADPVRTAPPPAGDVQLKTTPNTPTNGIGGTGGGRLQSDTYTQNPGTVTNSGGAAVTKGGITNSGSTILNNGTINDKR